ncbi:hypothetical protein SNEBB_008603 [Seison nebaliae]|nr:hypothetical protein SNEBB_008603 [Seison nebaliae]
MNLSKLLIDFEEDLENDSDQLLRELGEQLKKINSCQKMRNNNVEKSCEKLIFHQLPSMKVEKEEMDLSLSDYWNQIKEWKMSQLNGKEMCESEIVQKFSKNFREFLKEKQQQLLNNYRTTGKCRVKKIIGEEMKEEDDEMKGNRFEPKRRNRKKKRDIDVVMEKDLFEKETKKKNMENYFQKKNIGRIGLSNTTFQTGLELMKGDPEQKKLDEEHKISSNKFQPPFLSDPCPITVVRKSKKEKVVTEDEVELLQKENEELKMFEKCIIELLLREVVQKKSDVDWDDICGLEEAKKTLQEIVLLPIIRPDLFVGLRSPSKGLLLFGPPGTGKTMIGKCVANEQNFCFFSVSASSLTSKWIGEGEKLVRGLFALARIRSPSVIFIDEVDSLLTTRSEGEHESSRRIKTEFLVQLDGTSCTETDKILVIGATNRPQELDEAARRRFVKRVYIPLPDEKSREDLIRKLLDKSSSQYELTEENFREIVQRTENFSSADVNVLCRDAALGPLRSLKLSEIKSIKMDEVRPIMMKDFHQSFQRVNSSISLSSLSIYEEWNRCYGTF